MGLVGLAVLALLSGALNLSAQGPIGPDIGITLALQDLFASSSDWARFLTRTAKAPMLFATLVVAAALAWGVNRWRAALAVPLAYGLAYGADKLLRALIHSPKPVEELVHVATASSASGLPSTFALVYASVFGPIRAVFSPAGR